MGRPGGLPDRGVMAEPDLDPPRCEACRGRGWKLRRSRRAVILGTLARGAGGPARSSTCRDCDGRGTLPGPDTTSAGSEQTGPAQ